MKALSVQQPWPYAILHLNKPVENRTWRSGFTGRIKIHAGKTVDHGAVARLRSLGHHIPDNLPTGGYVGEVDVTGCVPVEKCAGNPWAFGPWCFTLANPVPHELIPARGMLGFFEVEEPK